MQKELSATLLGLRRKQPYFSTLALYLNYEFGDKTESIETDGRRVWINPTYFNRFHSGERASALAHVTWHCALLHTHRRAGRDATIWNIAADIVTNNILTESGMEPPPLTAVDTGYTDMSVEQVYRELERDASKLQKEMTRGQSSHSSSEQVDTTARNTDSDTKPPKADSKINKLEISEKALVLHKLYPAIADLAGDKSQARPDQEKALSGQQQFWKQALIKAQTVSDIHQKNQGLLPAGLVREIEQVLNPRLDWRTLLWRFMARTPNDFQGFDRRYIHRGLYLDQLQGEDLEIHIAIDTSGSIEDDELAQFRAEVEAISRSYHHLRIFLYYVDAEVNGPYRLDAGESVTRAIGGGGTDFSVFFDYIDKNKNLVIPALCVYLTDGLGTVPEEVPTTPVLWVLNANDAPFIPFGEVACLI